MFYISLLRRSAAAAMLFLAFLLPHAVQAQYPEGPESRPIAGVPQGTRFQFDYTSKHWYPGATAPIIVYIPAQYTPEKPACLCVGLDGDSFDVITVFNNLIAKKEMPVTIGVFIPSGTVNAPGTQTPIRFDRCFQFDSTNDRFDRFLLDEILPAVVHHKMPGGRAINISMDPNDHMIMGGSSGGVCAFTAAWQHPDLFRRVFTAVGTYVGMRGADQYPTLVRKTEPKPIRIFLQDGAQDTWNPLFDNWYTQNRSMEESLRFANYDVNHSWGVLGHEGSHATSIFPEVIKWLWRDYPTPITAGISGNSMLNAVLDPEDTWHPVAAGIADPSCLTVDPRGQIYAASRGPKGTIHRITGAGDVSTVFARTGAPIGALACDARGTVFVSQPSAGRLLAVDPAGHTHVFATGVRLSSLTVTDDDTLYGADLAAHDDQPSVIYRIRGGTKTIVDRGLRHATGVLLTPDHNLVFAAEGHTHWIYSYVMQPSGALTNKQRFYWLHDAESATDSGDYSDATDLMDDTAGDLFVATRMGVQICDRNGRVAGILSIPSGPVTSLCFGGADMKTLYVISGGRLYKRHMNVAGVAGFAKPMKLPDFGGG